MAEPNFKNRTLFHGDNLDFLRGMNSETVHLIATDPPFKKGKDFHATPDSLAAGARFQDRWSWTRDVHEEWTDSIIDDWPAVWEVITAARAAYGDDMGAFLCWLGVRLMEMHRVLRPDGSLYLHIDHTAHAYVKSILDAVFGWKNFRNEIVWAYRSGGVSKRWFGRKHDTILFYSKSNKYTIKVPKERSYNRDFKPYRFKGVDEFQDECGRWYTMATMRDVWEISMVGRTAGERTGYPTQKPLELYERIIEASSNEGDFVLDPFCGCATTPIAAEKLKRKWVGMDIWDGAQEQVLDRMTRDTILRTDENQHVTLPQVHYETVPPTRTDDNEIAAPVLRLKIQRPVSPWENIRHKGGTG